MYIYRRIYLAMDIIYICSCNNNEFEGEAMNLKVSEDGYMGRFG